MAHIKSIGLSWLRGYIADVEPLGRASPYGLPNVPNEQARQDTSEQAAWSSDDEVSLQDGPHSFWIGSHSFWLQEDALYGLPGPRYG